MFAERGEKRAAAEAVKMISCFSQEFQSEKFLLAGSDMSVIIGALSSESRRAWLVVAIAEGKSVSSTEPASEVYRVGACDETRGDS